MLRNQETGTSRLYINPGNFGASWPKGTLLTKNRRFFRKGPPELKNEHALKIRSNILIFLPKKNHVF